MKLELVNIIGKIYFHRFQTTDGFVEIETTEKEYNSLASGGCPTCPKGAIWVCSYEYHKFDTPDGKIQDGQYALQSTGQKIARFNGLQTEDAGTAVDVTGALLSTDSFYDIESLKG